MAGRPRDAQGRWISTGKPKTWLDKAGVAKAVKEAATKGPMNPLYRCAALVQVTAQTSMQGGRAAISAEDARKLGVQGRRAAGLARSKKKVMTIRVPSRAGTPPNAQAGTLRASIKVAMETDRSLVGPTTIYGRIQEFGGHIAVTPKMRGYLAWAYGWHLSPSKQTIHLPARPYMRPALRAAKPRFKGYFKNLPLAATPTGRRMNSRRTPGAA